MRLLSGKQHRAALLTQDRIRPRIRRLLATTVRAQCDAQSHCVERIIDL